MKFTFVPPYLAVTILAGCIVGIGCGGSGGDGSSTVNPATILAQINLANTVDEASKPIQSLLTTAKFGSGSGRYGNVSLTGGTVDTLATAALLDSLPSDELTLEDAYNSVKSNLDGLELPSVTKVIQDLQPQLNAAWADMHKPENGLLVVGFSGGVATDTPPLLSRTSLMGAFEEYFFDAWLITQYPAHSPSRETVAECILRETQTAYALVATRHTLYRTRVGRILQFGQLDPIPARFSWLPNRDLRYRSSLLRAGLGQDFDDAVDAALANGMTPDKGPLLLQERDDFVTFTLQALSTLVTRIIACHNQGGG